MNEEIYDYISDLLNDFKKEVEAFQEENIFLLRTTTKKIVNRTIMLLEDYKYNFKPEQIEDFIMERTLPVMKTFVNKKTNNFVDDMYEVVTNFTNSLDKINDKEQLNDHTKETYKNFDNIKAEKIRFDDLVIELSYLVKESRTISEIGPESSKILTSSIERVIMELAEYYVENKRNFENKIWNKVETLYLESQRNINNEEIKKEEEDSFSNPFL